MNPWIVRPQPQAQRLSNLLTQEGHQPLTMPLMQIQGLAPPADLQVRCQHADFIVVTSQHCVAQCYTALKATASPVFAIGPTTAKQLKHHGIHAIYPQKNPSTESLFPCIQQAFVNLENRRTLLLQGCNPRQLLTDVLINARVMIDTVYLYQRIALPVDIEHCVEQWHKYGVDSVIVTSGELLTYLFTLLQQTQEQRFFSHWVMYVISSRLQQQAIRLGFKHVELTQGVSDRAIADTLGMHS